MNIIKILGGVGAGILAAAGLVVAGRTGLGKSEAEPEEASEPAGGGDVPAETNSAEDGSSDADPADDAADA